MSQLDASPPPAPAISPAAGVEIHGSVYLGGVVAGFGKMLAAMVQAGAINSGDSDATASAMKTVVFLGIVVTIGLLVLAGGLLVTANRRGADRVVAGGAIIAAAIVIATAF